eukprot:gene2673-19727_t
MRRKEVEIEAGSEAHIWKGKAEQLSKQLSEHVAKEEERLMQAALELQKDQKEGEEEQERNEKPKKKEHQKGLKEMAVDAAEQRKKRKDQIQAARKKERDLKDTKRRGSEAEIGKDATKAEGKSED